MIPNDLGRRDFHRLSLAAFTGVLAGSLFSACKSDDKKSSSASGENPMLSEPHVCRGLNTCKGMGAGGGNQCAGMGACASAKAHSCAGSNACKGQGGCKGTAGMNDCKGHGGCAVPLKADAWTSARAGFEGAMKAKGKQVGMAPAKG